MVDDLDETLAWYRENLDASLVAELPTEPDVDSWWAQVTMGDVSIMFQERDNLIEKIPAVADMDVGTAAPIFISVDDAQYIHDRLDESSASIVQSLHETEFGWLQFAVRDPNGYILWFGEKLTSDRRGPVIR